MKDPRLFGDLAGGGQIGQGAHLLGVVRLQLQELTLELMDLDLSVGREHAPG